MKNPQQMLPVKKLKITEIYEKTMKYTVSTDGSEATENNKKQKRFV